MEIALPDFDIVQWLVQTLVPVAFGAGLTLFVSWILARQSRKAVHADERRAKVYAPLFDELPGLRTSLRDCTFPITTEYDKIRVEHVLRRYVPRDLRLRIMFLYDTVIPTYRRSLKELQDKYRREIFSDLTGSTSGVPGIIIRIAQDLANNLCRYIPRGELPSEWANRFDGDFQQIRREMSLPQSSVSDYFTQIAERLRSQNSDLTFFEESRKVALELADKIERAIAKDLEAEA